MEYAMGGKKEKKKGICYKRITSKNKYFDLTNNKFFYFLLKDH
jgi:hypothetical protein